MIANISTDKHCSTAINQYSLISDAFWPTVILNDSPINPWSIIHYQSIYSLICIHLFLLFEGGLLDFCIYTA